MSKRFDSTLTSVEREEVLPDRRDRDLEVALGLHLYLGVLDSGTVWRRQRVAVDLPVGCAGKSIEEHEGAGHHVVGQRRAQVGAQLGSDVPELAFADRHRVGGALRRADSRCRTCSTSGTCSRTPAIGCDAGSGETRTFGTPACATPETIYRRLMRVHLDSGKCQGHNRCYALAPELFDVDDYGQAVLLVDGDVPDRARQTRPGSQRPTALSTRSRSRSNATHDRPRRCDQQPLPTPTVAQPRRTYLPVVGDRPEGTDVWQRVPYDAADYGPVTDFATDFDHADPEYNPNAPKVWKELREGGCPVAHSDRYGGMWVPLTHDTVNDVAYDTENFTSRAVVVTRRPPRRPGDAGADRRRAADHQRPAVPQRWPAACCCRRSRRSRSSRGSRRSAGSAESCSTRSATSRPARPSSTPRSQYAQHIPVNVIGRMLGFPAEDERPLPQVRARRRSSASPRSPSTSDGMDDLDNYILAQVAGPLEQPARRPHQLPARRRDRRAAVSDDIVGGMIILLLVAGIDTTWSAIGSSLWHLAQHPDDRSAWSTSPRS